MRYLCSLTILMFALPSLAADLTKLPANTFVEIEYKTLQFPGSDDRGQFAPQGWNKLVYDPDGRRVLLYDRWIDKRHGGYTIYGNCLFGFDPVAGTMTPIKVDHWTKRDEKNGGYRTLALPENEAEPTPAPRHVYHAFEYVSDRKAVYLCNGANQTILDKSGKLVGHDLCDGAWKLDLATNKWTRIESKESPRNFLDDAMAYSPPTKSIVYAGANRQLWILDLEQQQFRQAKNSPPQRTSMGQTIFYDAPRQRMLIVGGGTLDAWLKGPAPAFHELHAFDPQTETVRRLADAPTTLYSQHFAHDTVHDLFFAVAVFNKGEQKSGMFAYDPKTDAWRDCHPTNTIPPHNSWFGWMQLCYDSHNRCLIGKIANKFYAFRYEL